MIPVKLQFRLFFHNSPGAERCLGTPHFRGKFQRLYMPENLFQAYGQEKEVPQDGELLLFQQIFPIIYNPSQGQLQTG